jgi:ATP-dependent Lhr-like helicase
LLDGDQPSDVSDQEYQDQNPHPLANSTREGWGTRDSHQPSAISGQENQNPHPLANGTREGWGTRHPEDHNLRWEPYFQQLMAQQRAMRARVGERGYWVAAERAEEFATMFPAAEFEGRGSLTSGLSLEEVVLTTVRGWMPHIGPVTARKLGERLGVPCTEIEKALLRMEATGAILRGKFLGGASSEDSLDVEWCERRLLARIHRLTVATLRKQIEPVTASQFMNWLLRWQHVEPGSQVQGERGVLEVLRQLQGFEIPASAWERYILRGRVEEYDPKWLDQLCLQGFVGWGRLSPHPAMVQSTQPSVVGHQEGQKPHPLAKDAREGWGTRLEFSPNSEETEIPRPTEQSVGSRDDVGSRVERSAGSRDDNQPQRQRRVIPTSVAPVTFFMREEADWMAPRHPEENSVGLSEAAAQVLKFLQQRGASFFPDIVRGTGKLKAEVEAGLWELVAVGLVTADGFDNLRSLIDPKRRNVRGNARPRHNPGRWALLYSDPVERNRAAEAACWMLLRRYGVVFRDLLTRETNLPTWRELQIAFRRLEDRGEIRGGRFVDGFNGEQFALPVAVESLRAHRKLAVKGDVVSVSAADPLNLVGILVPGERVPAISTRTVEFIGGKIMESVVERAAGD